MKDDEMAFSIPIRDWNIDSSIMIALTLLLLAYLLGIETGIIVATDWYGNVLLAYLLGIETRVGVLKLEELKGF